MKQIEVVVSSSGEIKLTTSGFSGHSCLEESQFLKDALGNELYQQLTPIALQANKTSHVLICQHGGFSQE